MRTLTIAVAVSMWTLVCVGPAAAQGAANAANCSTYARNRSESEAGGGRGAVGGAARGATRGALFGAIIGGKKGAGRGAALGGGLGAVRGGTQGSNDREYLYRRYYDECMRGQR